MDGAPLPSWWDVDHDAHGHPYRCANERNDGTPCGARMRMHTVGDYWELAPAPGIGDEDRAEQQRQARRGGRRSLGSRRAGRGRLTGHGSRRCGASTVSRHYPPGR